MRPRRRGAKVRTVTSPSARTLHGSCIVRPVYRTLFARSDPGEHLKGRLDEFEMNHLRLLEGDISDTPLSLFAGSALRTHQGWGY